MSEATPAKSGSISSSLRDRLQKSARRTSSFLSDSRENSTPLVNRLHSGGSSPIVGLSSNGTSPLRVGTPRANTPLKRCSTQFRSPVLGRQGVTLSTPLRSPNTTLAAAQHKQKVAERESQLRRLRWLETQTKRHTTAALREMTAEWRRVCREAVEAYSQDRPECSPPQVLAALGISAEVASWDENAGEWNT